MCIFRHAQKHLDMYLTWEIKIGKGGIYLALLVIIWIVSWFTKNNLMTIFLHFIYIYIYIYIYIICVCVCARPRWIESGPGVLPLDSYRIDVLTSSLRKTIGITWQKHFLLTEFLTPVSLSRIYSILMQS